MGKYNSNTITSKFTQDYINKQLWKNNYSDYVPFLNVRSVPSKGKVTRIKGWKTGRIHHFLSKLECNAFYYFDWSENVIDIKEQYPLLPIDILQNIALKAGIEYPNFNGKPTIMTTDFLITTLENNNTIQYARTVKPSSDLSNERIIEKFEIERRFFKSKNINWGIITEKELSHTFSNNMEILHSNKLNYNKTGIKQHYTFAIYTQLINQIEKTTSNDVPIAYILTKLSEYLNMTFSEIIKAFFNAIIDKILVLNIYEKALDINTLTIKDITVNNKILINKFDEIKEKNNENLTN